MKQLEDKVLQKMSLQRLKGHRTTVLAYINKEFYEYEDGVIRIMKEGIDSTAFDAAISYRNKVNKFYDAARTAPKVK
jgi:hypothetical protein